MYNLNFKGAKVLMQKGGGGGGREVLGPSIYVFITYNYEMKSCAKDFCITTFQKEFGMNIVDVYDKAYTFS